MINLKPFRNYSEYDVYAMFAFNGASQTKGVMVDIVNSGFVNGADQLRIAYNLAPGIDGGNVYSPVWENVSRVGLAASGSKPFGMLLYDVLNTKTISDTLAYLRYDPVRRKEAQCALSGEGVAVVRAGLFTVSGIQGVVANGNYTNSGVKVSDSGNGEWALATLTDTNCFGRILGGADKQGFVVVDIDTRK